VVVSVATFDAGCLALSPLSNGIGNLSAAASAAAAAAYGAEMITKQSTCY